MTVFIWPDNNNVLQIGEKSIIIFVEKVVKINISEQDLSFSSLQTKMKFSIYEKCCNDIQCKFQTALVLYTHLFADQMMTIRSIQDVFL